MKYLVVIFLLIIAYYLFNNVKENWTVYKQKPYNYYLSGSSPLGFYRRDVYRKPYRYPFKFNSSYLLNNRTYYN